MLPATFKLCAAISYQHLRNMTGEGPGRRDTGLGEPLAGGVAGREEAGGSGDALPTQRPCGFSGFMFYCLHG